MQFLSIIYAFIYLYVIIFEYNIFYLCYSVTHPNLLFNELACTNNTEQYTCMEWSQLHYYSCTECIVTVSNILLLTLTFVMIQYLLFKLKQCVYC